VTTQKALFFYIISIVFLIKADSFCRWQKQQRLQ